MPGMLITDADTQTRQDTDTLRTHLTNTHAHWGH